ncbi:hypothetical protein [Bacillus toyonensis]|nr:hypothetical protein [Bacillus toyonensis]
MGVKKYFLQNKNTFLSKQAKSLERITFFIKMMGMGERQENADLHS